MPSEWPPIEQTHVLIEIDGPLYKRAIQDNIALTWLGSKEGITSQKPLSGPWMEKAEYERLVSQI